ncbi:uncharacterized protein B0P05DRAFT_593106 [Gilbertella persicaria]|uniref:uncharacterized protein n=1 Tax=Gilbertella persicaria TaxID=101096 RepID=UPI0022211D0C|nr:uncharacterized protein B0P05DRAFT_593106 [Gilbertella persicaria]KAI8098307.1 hypothetical protein B0P05DRAFT_593106 [Gilbertella persicaria]
MKILLFIYLCVALFVGSSWAIVRTEEVFEWTKETLGSYFDKYKITYDKNQGQESLVEIAQAYKDAAEANVRYFGNSVDQIVSGFNIDLKKNSHLAQNDVDSFITNLKHQLRQLELKGQLSKEHVKQVLDKAHTEAIRQKLLTEAEWKKAYSKFESHYQQPTWYQRVLRAKSDVEDGSSSFNKWFQSIADRISHVGGMTKEEAQNVAEQVRTSIENTDLQKLGDSAWVDSLAQSISEKTQMKKEQVSNVLDSIKKDVYGFKIFGLEYTGQAKEHAKNWYEYAKCCCQGFWERIRTSLRNLQARLYHMLHIDQIKKPKYITKHATESIKSAASSLSEDWHSSSKSMAHSRSIHSAMSKVSNAAAQATNKIQDIDFKNLDIKDSFAHFWRKKEHDAYRKLGYTEAHIDWIHNYLYKTFANQKAMVRGKSDEAAIAIKRYLNELKIQKPDQIDQHVNKLRGHLETWRTLVDD